MNPEMTEQEKVTEGTADFLSQVVIFTDLKREDLRQVARLFNQVCYPRQAVIFFQAEKGDHFYIVKSGSVKIYRLTEDGREIILDVFATGDFFGEMALLDKDIRSATVQTREPTTLLVMRRTDFQEMIQRQPEIALNIISILSQRLRRANTTIENFAFGDARLRVIHAITKLGQSYGKSTKKGLRLDLRVTHQELASLVGTSRETVTRTLLEMQNEGLVSLEQRHLVIHNLEALEKITRRIT